MPARASCLQLEEYIKMRTKSGLFGVRSHKNRLFKTLSKDRRIFTKLRVDTKINEVAIDLEVSCNALL